MTSILDVLNVRLRDVNYCHSKLFEFSYGYSFVKVKGLMINNLNFTCPDYLNHGGVAYIVG